VKMSRATNKISNKIYQGVAAFQSREPVFFNYCTTLIAVMMYLGF